MCSVLTHLRYSRYLSTLRYSGTHTWCCPYSHKCLHCDMDLTCKVSVLKIAHTHTRQQYEHIECHVRTEHTHTFGASIDRVKSILTTIAVGTIVISCTLTDKVCARQSSARSSIKTRIGVTRIDICI